MGIAGTTFSAGTTLGYTSNSNYFITNQPGVSISNTGFSLTLGYSAGVTGGVF